MKTILGRLAALLRGQLLGELQDGAELVGIAADRVEVVRRLRGVIQVRRVGCGNVRDLVLADRLLQCFGVAGAPSDDGVDTVDVPILAVQ